MKDRYPKLVINIDHIRNNVRQIVESCDAMGIKVAGVIKGANGLVEISKVFDEAGVAFIASSRIEQLQDVKESGIKKELMLIRIPMISEAEDVIRIADISLNSELKVIKALNEEAGKQGRVHKVILMADVGDLREGFWDKDELVNIAMRIESNMTNIHLAGVGFNVGCYGSIIPTIDKMEELISLAERVEKCIGRKLEYISGGATTSLLRVHDLSMPGRINLLRIGEGILLARDLEISHGVSLEGMYQDTFILKAEIVELKDKHTNIGRKRALLAIGKVDYGDPFELEVMDEGVEIIGASSDYTVVELVSSSREWEIGDILNFGVTYATAVYLSKSRSVNINYV